MKIIACYKLVPEEQDIAINADKTLDTSRADVKISLYDLNAVEAAVQLASQVEGSTVTALSVGGRALEQSKARKDVLSRGPDALAVVMDEKLEGALPRQTASALAGALHQLPHDLVLCGEGSGDLYAQQVGLLLGEMLGLPAVNGVVAITPEDNSVVVERMLENEVEVLRVPLPAVLSLCADCNLPRIPGMKAILAAGKKPVTALPLADLAAASSSLAGVRAPALAERRAIILDGDTDEQIAAFADELRNALQ